MGAARKHKNASHSEPVQPSLALELVLPALTADSTTPREPEQLLLRSLQLVSARVESVHAQQRLIVEGLRNIEQSLPQQRRALSRQTQCLHIETVSRKRAGLCPCCQETPVADDQGRLPNGEYDHWFSRSQNGAKQTWLICSACNARLAIETEFKNGCRSAFESYQQALRPLLSKQTQLALADAGSAA